MLTEKNDFHKNPTNQILTDPTIAPVSYVHRLDRYVLINLHLHCISMLLQTCRLSNKLVEIVTDVCFSGYTDAGDDWRSGYDIDGSDYNFREDLERLYADLKPFYKEVSK